MLKPGVRLRPVRIPEKESSSLQNHVGPDRDSHPRCLPYYMASSLDFRAQWKEEMFALPLTPHKAALSSGVAQCPAVCPVPYRHVQSPGVCLVPYGHVQSPGVCLVPCRHVQSPGVCPVPWCVPRALVCACCPADMPRALVCVRCPADMPSALPCAQYPVDMPRALPGVCPEPTLI